MMALSIRYPWWYGILHFGKGVENREWERGPRWMVGQTFLIHAAKGCTRGELCAAAACMSDIYEARPWPGSTILPALARVPKGAIVGRSRLAEVVKTTPEGHRYRPTENHTCTLCGEGAVLRRGGPPPCPKADPWAVPGALGLILADVETIETPVPVKGALGFFEVDDALLVGATWKAVGP
jgi:hypothetical protein